MWLAWPAISVRQLQWRDERKLVSPGHEDHRGVYVPEQVQEMDHNAKCH
jgi:hypothetical protein